MTALEHRYDFVLLFDVRDGNPNGDPDAGNMPRFDPETGQGLVTDVCLKRKVRNYVELKHGNNEPYRIYVREGAVLNREHQKAYEALGKKSEKQKLAGPEITKWMCQNYYDIRTFGAVMSTEVNAGQVRGPVQLTFARSIEPVFARDFAVTRLAVTNEADIAKERTIGRKHAVAYGLYRAHGFVSAALAEKTGFSKEDLDLLFEALREMFEHDRSAARGLMTTRHLVVFEHGSKLGDAPAHLLFDRVRVEPVHGGRPARAFEDYRVTLDGAPLGDRFVRVPARVG
ncbi:MAG: type I-C CRISPR-associated protein Cas7/Csd2 [Geminicoccaceae bacterium]|nr:type I-C CRISPR-associated protein Cas7/Csd2 [Geminicoccaceae bacterium]MDW8126023.1 type I-C CRISPR-associated protein Cas7/Csd2 [Geminicoccaceae bacterium]